MDEINTDKTIESKAMLGAPRVLRPSDPDVFDNPESARVRARQIGCIGIRRYNNRDGGVSWMPCTNESDYRRVSGFGASGRRFRRQQLEREVRQIIGSSRGASMRKKSANYTKPEMRERIKDRIMAGSKGGAPGQWSARKAQLLAIAYRKAGGGYRGKRNAKQRSLSRWTKQKWRTIDGKPARRGNIVRRYLPAKAWARLTPGQRRATNRKKIQGSKLGRQFVPNTDAARRARKRAAVSKKHAEFYETIEYKAIGGRIGRALPGRLGSGSGSGGRRARRVGASIRGSMARFDPTPINRDGDNLVQEGTIYERPAPPGTPIVSPKFGRRVSRDAQIDRATTIRNRRLATPAARAISSGRTPSRRTGAAKPPRVISTRRNVPKPRGTSQRRVPRQPTAPRGMPPRKVPQEVPIEEPKPNVIPRPKPRTVPRPAPAPAPKPTPAPRTPFVPAGVRGAMTGDEFREAELETLKSQRADVYSKFRSGEFTVSQLADIFGVLREDITKQIQAHEKFRNNNMRNFRRKFPKFIQAMQSFANSRGSFDEAIRERKFTNWDNMVPYVFRDAKLRKTGKHLDMQNDLFNAFPNGTNPDGKSNITLGYAPSRIRANKNPIKTYNDSRKPTPNFLPLSRGVSPFVTAGSASDIRERGGLRGSYRRDALTAEAMRLGQSISGQMANMTPAEEKRWKQKEWSRQQLKNLALDKDLQTKYPSLAAEIGTKPLVDAIISLDALDDAKLDALWTATKNEIVASGGSLPAYQARNAPLSPRELALAATQKRPLVSAFIDEYKSISPNGVLAKLDPSKMSDADIESFYNTFILPELTNNGSPDTAAIKSAVSSPTSTVRMSEAEKILLGVPLNLQTMDLRLKLAKRAVQDSGIDPTSPEFETALQKMLDDTMTSEIEKLIQDVEQFIIKEITPTQRIAVNPLTGKEYTEDELMQLLSVVKNNIEQLASTIDAEMLERLSLLNTLQSLMVDARQNYTDKYHLGFTIPTNPATGKKYTPLELREHIGNIENQIEALRITIGSEILGDIDKQQRLQSALERVMKEAGFGQFDPPPDAPDFQEPRLPGPTINDLSGEEITELLSEINGVLQAGQQVPQDVIDELFDKTKAIITDRLGPIPEIQADDVIAARKMQQKLQEEIGVDRYVAPDTDEYWDKLTENVPYDGSPSHPLNFDENGTPLNLDAADLRLPGNLYDFINPSSELAEWRDLGNTHTVGRYTDVPKELHPRFYKGDVQSSDPEKIDKRISWDRLISYIQKTAPNWFRRDNTADVSVVTQNGNYGGASFSSADFNPNVPSSAYQNQAQIEEWVAATRKAQTEQYLDQTRAAASERAKIWDLHSVQNLTPDEIAFDLEIVDPQVVSQAIAMHIIDANISDTERKRVAKVATTSAQNRQPQYEKRRLQRLIDNTRALAALEGDPRSTAADMIQTIESAIARQEETIRKVGIEYDGFRRAHQMLINMAHELLSGRPPLRAAIYDSQGNVVQTGWDRRKEPLSRYINRIRRWDLENIGYRRADGTTYQGPVKIIVDRIRALSLQTGDDAGASATTFIFNRAQANIKALRQYQNELRQLSSDARSAGISGFMRSGGSIDRAEDFARRGARKAAAGLFEFSDPRILKRYDSSGFSVNRRMLGAASGFNPQFADEIRDSTRRITNNLSDGPDFGMLNPLEQKIIRGFDELERARTARGATEAMRKMNRNATANSISEQMQKIQSNRAYEQNVFDLEAFSYANKKNRVFYPISGAMQNDDEYIFLASMAVEKLPDGKWYIVNQHGQSIDDKAYETEKLAMESIYSMRDRIKETGRRRDYPGSTPEMLAAKAGMKQSGYRSTSALLNNVMDVSPIGRDGNPNEFIFKKDAEGKKRAGDAVIMRRNPETNEPEILVIERLFGPHRTSADGTYSLPGGFFDEGVDADVVAAAVREAFEEVGLPEDKIVSIKRLGIIDSPDWDPRFSKGMEVGGVLLEVPSDFVPRAGDDAAGARFVPLSEIANGNIAMGFGHAAWLEAAFGDSQDETIYKYVNGLSIANQLSRERQQRIIKAVNIKRKQWNDGISTRELNLFDQKTDKIGLFPNDLGFPSYGWKPTGPEVDARVAEARKRALAEAREHLRRHKNGRDFPPRISGTMRGEMMEVDEDDFQRNIPEDIRANITDDVLEQRRKGNTARSIAQNLSLLYSLDDDMMVDGKHVAPTDQLVKKIIDDNKVNAGDMRDPIDEFVRKNNDDLLDVASIASAGVNVQQIADLLDMSPKLAKKYTSGLGIDVPEGEISRTSSETARRKFANLDIAKQLYIDSVYERMTVDELAKKYKLPLDRVTNEIASYRQHAESQNDIFKNYYRGILRNGGNELLTSQELGHVNRRLDGMSRNEIAKSMGLSENVVLRNEMTALAKLRSLDEYDGMYEIGKERALKQLRSLPVTEYIDEMPMRVAAAPAAPSAPGGDDPNKNIPESNKKYLRKLLAYRDLRDFRNSTKDAYMMNQYMGQSVAEIAEKQNKNPSDIERAIRAYSNAVEKSDTIRDKALRRAIASVDANLFTEGELVFLNMRNDGASLGDMARYFESTPNEMRAMQMSLMSRLNSQYGISGAMRSLPELKDQNLYGSLGIPSDSPDEDIHDAFMDIMREHFVPAFKGDPDSQKIVKSASNAYAVLSNIESREMYDNGELNFDDNIENWDMGDDFLSYVDKSTNQRRHRSFAYAMQGETLSPRDSFRAPHDTGSDVISDDIDDSFLGFGLNDKSPDILSNDRIFRKPVPGTSEWRDAKRRGEMAQRSGDPRFTFDEDGFIVGQTLNRIERFDNPMAPDYVGDQYGGPPKGEPEYSPLSGVSGQMKSVPPGVWKIGKPRWRQVSRPGYVKSKRIRGLFTGRKTFAGEKISQSADALTLTREISESVKELMSKLKFKTAKELESGGVGEYVTSSIQLAESMAEDYEFWMNNIDGREVSPDLRIDKLGLSSYSNDLSSMGNLKIAEKWKFDIPEFLNAVDALYDSMDSDERARSTAVLSRNFMGTTYTSYPITPKRPFMRTTPRVQTIRDIASGKLRKFVYWNRQIYPGELKEITDQDGNKITVIDTISNEYKEITSRVIDSQRQTDADGNPIFSVEQLFVDFPDQIEVWPSSQMLGAVELDMDKDPELALTYVRASIIGNAVSGPWLESSNGNLETILLHQAVRRVFNLKPNTASYAEDLDGAKRSWRLGNGQALGKLPKIKLLDKIKQNRKKISDSDIKIPEQLEKFLDGWVKAAYKETQSYLRENDIKFVQLYRGVSLPEMIERRRPDGPDSSRYGKFYYGDQPFDTQYKDENGNKLGTIIKKFGRGKDSFINSSLSSWTISPAWARVFAMGEFGPSEFDSGQNRASKIRQMLGASVVDSVIPAEHILSLPHIGLGTAQSGEVIVIGKELPSVRIRHVDALPPKLWWFIPNWMEDDFEQGQRRGIRQDRREVLTPPETTFGSGSKFVRRGQEYFMSDIEELTRYMTAEERLAEKGVDAQEIQSAISGKMKNDKQFFSDETYARDWSTERRVRAQRERELPKDVDMDALKTELMKHNMKANESLKDYVNRLKSAVKSLSEETEIGKQIELLTKELVDAIDTNKNIQESQVTKLVELEAIRASADEFGEELRRQLHKRINGIEDIFEASKEKIGLDKLIFFVRSESAALQAEYNATRRILDFVKNQSLPRPAGIPWMDPVDPLWEGFPPLGKAIPESRAKFIENAEAKLDALQKIINTSNDIYESLSPNESEILKYGNESILNEIFNEILQDSPVSITRYNDETVYAYGRRLANTVREIEGKIEMLTHELERAKWHQKGYDLNDEQQKYIDDVIFNNPAAIDSLTELRREYDKAIGDIKDLIKRKGQTVDDDYKALDFTDLRYGKRMRAYGNVRRRSQDELTSLALQAIAGKMTDDVSASEIVDAILANKPSMLRMRTNEPYVVYLARLRAASNELSRNILSRISTVNNVTGKFQKYRGRTFREALSVGEVHPRDISAIKNHMRAVIWLDAIKKHIDDSADNLRSVFDSVLTADRESFGNLILSGSGQSLETLTEETFDDFYRQILDLQKFNVDDANNVVAPSGGPLEYGTYTDFDKINEMLTLPLTMWPQSYVNLDFDALATQEEESLILATLSQIDSSQPVEDFASRVVNTPNFDKTKYLELKEKVDSDIARISQNIDDIESQIALAVPATSKIKIFDKYGMQEHALRSQNALLHNHLSYLKKRAAAIDDFGAISGLMPSSHRAKPVGYWVPDSKAKYPRPIWANKSDWLAHRYTRPTSKHIKQIERMGSKINVSKYADDAVWFNFKNPGTNGEISSPFFTVAGRPIIIFAVNGKRIPFYRSSGRNRKPGVFAGRWYPFFGINEKGGWFNKFEGMDRYYDVPQFKEISEFLNEHIDDLPDADQIRWNAADKKDKATFIKVKGGWVVDSVDANVGIKTTIAQAMNRDLPEPFTTPYVEPREAQRRIREIQQAVQSYVGGEMTKTITAKNQIKQIAKMSRNAQAFIETRDTSNKLSGKMTDEQNNSPDIVDDVFNDTAVDELLDAMQLDDEDREYYRSELSDARAQLRFELSELFGNKDRLPGYRNIPMDKAIIEALAKEDKEHFRIKVNKILLAALTDTEQPDVRNVRKLKDLTERLAQNEAKHKANLLLYRVIVDYDNGFSTSGQVQRYVDVLGKLIDGTAFSRMRKRYELIRKKPWSIADYKADENDTKLTLLRTAVENDGHHIYGEISRLRMQLENPPGGRKIRERAAGIERRVASIANRRLNEVMGEALQNPRTGITFNFDKFASDTADQVLREIYVDVIDDELFDLISGKMKSNQNNAFSARELLQKMSSYVPEYKDGALRRDIELLIQRAGDFVRSGNTELESINKQTDRLRKLINSLEQKTNAAVDKYIKQSGKNNFGDSAAAEIKNDPKISALARNISSLTSLINSLRDKVKSNNNASTEYSRRINDYSLPISTHNRLGRATINIEELGITGRMTNDDNEQTEDEILEALSPTAIRKVDGTGTNTQLANTVDWFETMNTQQQDIKREAQFGLKRQFSDKEEAIQKISEFEKAVKELSNPSYYNTLSPEQKKRTDVDIIANAQAANFWKEKLNDIDETIDFLNREIRRADEQINDLRIQRINEIAELERVTRRTFLDNLYRAHNKLAESIHLEKVISFYLGKFEDALNSGDFDRAVLENEKSFPFVTTGVTELSTTIPDILANLTYGHKTSGANPANFLLSTNARRALSVSYDGERHLVKQWPFVAGPILSGDVYIIEEADLNTGYDTIVDGGWIYSNSLIDGAPDDLALKRALLEELVTELKTSRTVARKKIYEAMDTVQAARWFLYGSGDIPDSQRDEEANFIHNTNQSPFDFDFIQVDDIRMLPIDEANSMIKEWNQKNGQISEKWFQKGFVSEIGKVPSSDFVNWDIPVWLSYEVSTRKEDDNGNPLATRHTLPAEIRAISGKMSNDDQSDFEIFEAVEGSGQLSEEDADNLRRLRRLTQGTRIAKLSGNGFSAELSIQALGQLMRQRERELLEMHDYIAGVQTLKAQRLAEMDTITKQLATDSSLTKQEKNSLRVLLDGHLERLKIFDDAVEERKNEMDVRQLELINLITDTDKLVKDYSLNTLYAMHDEFAGLVNKQMQGLWYIDKLRKALSDPNHNWDDVPFPQPKFPFWRQYAYYGDIDWIGSLNEYRNEGPSTDEPLSLYLKIATPARIYDGPNPPPTSVPLSADMYLLRDAWPNKPGPIRPNEITDKGVDIALKKLFAREMLGSLERSVEKLQEQIDNQASLIRSARRIGIANQDKKVDIVELQAEWETVDGQINDDWFELLFDKEPAFVNRTNTDWGVPPDMVKWSFNKNRKFNKLKYGNTVPFTQRSSTPDGTVTGKMESNSEQTLVEIVDAIRQGDEVLNKLSDYFKERRLIDIYTPVSGVLLENVVGAAVGEQEKQRLLRIADRRRSNLNKLIDHLDFERQSIIDRTPYWQKKLNGARADLKHIFETIENIRNNDALSADEKKQEIQVFDTIIARTKERRNKAARNLQSMNAKLKNYESQKKKFIKEVDGLNDFVIQIVARDINDAKGDVVSVLFDEHDTTAGLLNTIMQARWYRDKLRKARDNDDYVSLPFGDAPPFHFTKSRVPGLNYPFGRPQNNIVEDLNELRHISGIQVRGQVIPNLDSEEFEVLDSYGLTVSLGKNIGESKDFDFIVATGWPIRDKQILSGKKSWFDDGLGYKKQLTGVESYNLTKQQDIEARKAFVDQTLQKLDAFIKEFESIFGPPEAIKSYKLESFRRGLFGSSIEDIDLQKLVRLWQQADGQITEQWYNTLFDDDMNRLGVWAPSWRRQTTNRRSENSSRTYGNAIYPRPSLVAPSNPPDSGQSITGKMTDYDKNSFEFKLRKLDYQLSARKLSMAQSDYLDILHKELQVKSLIPLFEKAIKNNNFDILNTLLENRHLAPQNSIRNSSYFGYERITPLTKTSAKKLLSQMLKDITSFDMSRAVRRGQMRTQRNVLRISQPFDDDVTELIQRWNSLNGNPDNEWWGLLDSRIPQITDGFVSGQMSAPWDDSYAQSLNLNLPDAKNTDDMQGRGYTTYNWFASTGNEADTVEMRATFGGTINVRKDRFDSLYKPIADAISRAVTKRTRAKGERKKFVSVGGAPGSGKTSMRLMGVGRIPSIFDAAHVDADKIKTLIPEARIMYERGDKFWADAAHEESRLIADLSLQTALDNDLDIVYDSTGQFNSGFDTLKAARAKGYDIVMHYVAAPEQTLLERVIEREKTDLRELPKHIIPATMNRNFSIMPDVAKASDEFYLWDSSGNNKVLIAHKQPGKELVIVDPRAYLYGDFDESGQTVTRETPISTRRSRKVAKGSFDALIITDRENGLTFDDISKKHRISKKRAFEIYGTTEIDPNLPEVKPYRQQNLAQTAQPKQDKTSNYVNDDKAKEIFLALPDKIQNDILQMVSGTLDDETKSQLTKYLKQNEIPADVTVWAWENINSLLQEEGDEIDEDAMFSQSTIREFDALPNSTKDSIASALESGSDPLEIAQILGTRLPVIEYAAYLLYGDYGFDSISGYMSNNPRDWAQYRNFYEVLGLDSNATAEDIRRAYKRLARRMHPDVNKETDATRKFQELNIAHETLANPSHRQLYDRWLGNNPRNQAGRRTGFTRSQAAPAEPPVPDYPINVEEDLRRYNARLPDDDWPDAPFNENTVFPNRAMSEQEFNEWHDWTVHRIQTTRQPGTRIPRGPDVDPGESRNTPPPPDEPPTTPTAPKPRKPKNPPGTRGPIPGEERRPFDDIFNPPWGINIDPDETDDDYGSDDPPRPVFKKPNSTSLNSLMRHYKKTKKRWSDEEISEARISGVTLPQFASVSGKMTGYEDLDPDLHDFIDESNNTGFPWIRHPLFIGMISPVFVDMINQTYRQKLDAVKKARENKNWDRYLFMHERPYRLDAFMEVSDEMNDEDYWRHLGEIWIDSENIWQNYDVWDEALDSARPGRENMMTEEERKEFDKLPDRITIYRGFNVGLNEEGKSWTTSKERAEWFAKRFSAAGKEPGVASGVIAKKDVIAYFTRRGESEIVVGNTDNISGFMTSSDEINPENEDNRLTQNIKRAVARERGEAMAESMLDAIARTSGFLDWEHYALSKKNADELAFAEKYSGGPGKLAWDPDLVDGFHYRVDNDSGYFGIHRGAGMDIHHPTAGAVDFISFTDRYKHSLLTPMTPEEWPSPQRVQHELDEWVKQYREDYDRNYGKP